MKSQLSFVLSIILFVNTANFAQLAPSDPKGVYINPNRSKKWYYDPQLTEEQKQMIQDLAKQREIDERLEKKCCPPVGILYNGLFFAGFLSLAVYLDLNIS